MKPCEHRGQIFWRKRWPEQSVQNHEHANKQEWNLQNCTGMAPLEEATDKRHTQQIKARRRFEDLGFRNGADLRQR
jgi:hypothetical protein